MIKFTALPGTRNRAIARTLERIAQLEHELSLWERQSQPYRNIEHALNCERDILDVLREV